MFLRLEVQKQSNRCSIAMTKAIQFPSQRVYEYHDYSIAFLRAASHRVYTEKRLVQQTQLKSRRSQQGLQKVPMSTHFLRNERTFHLSGDVQ